MVAEEWPYTLNNIVVHVLHVYSQILVRKMLDRTMEIYELRILGCRRKSNEVRRRLNHYEMVGSILKYPSVLNTLVEVRCEDCTDPALV